MEFSATATPKLSSSASPNAEPVEFSLVLGGPLYQLLRRAHLSDDVLFFVRRRVVVLVALAWVPLMMLAIAEGHAWSGGSKVPFIHDIELHIRLLIAMPLLVVAELVVHQRMLPVVAQFLTRELIPDPALGQFEAAVTATIRLRNSVSVEVLLLAFVFVMDFLLFGRNQLALGVDSWYGITVDGNLHPSLAGWWALCVSLPLFQFLLLRWYFRLFLWARFLWKVSRIELHFWPAHPDRCGGLGFLTSVVYAFTPVLLAQGVLMAGMIASRIFYSGATLPEFKVELIGLVAVMVFAILGPLLVFTPKLAAARRTGLREYGGLAHRYVRDFDHKWLRGGAGADEPLIGSADVQSLSDMGGSFAVVREMRLVPFSTRTAFELGVVTLLPVAPLLLTMISLEELLTQLLKVLF